MSASLSTSTATLPPLTVRFNISNNGTTSLAAAIRKRRLRGDNDTQNERVSSTTSTDVNHLQQPTSELSQSPIIIRPNTIQSADVHLDETMSDEAPPPLDDATNGHLDIFTSFDDTGSMTIAGAGGKKTTRKQTFPPPSPTRNKGSTESDGTRQKPKRIKTVIVELDDGSALLHKEKKLGASSTMGKKRGRRPITNNRFRSMARDPPTLTIQSQQQSMPVNEDTQPAPSLVTEGGGDSSCTDDKPIKLVLDIGKIKRRIHRKRRDQVSAPRITSSSSAAAVAEATAKKRRRRRTKLEMEAARANKHTNRSAPVNNDPPSAPIIDPQMRRAVEASVMLPDESCPLMRECACCWHSLTNARLCGGSSTTSTSLPKYSDMIEWNVSQTSRFISQLAYMDARAVAQFTDQLIDGEALLLLTRDDFVHQLSAKLGPAVKLYNLLLHVKHRQQREVAASMS